MRALGECRSISSARMRTEDLAMHTVTFYPIGNADSCLIELENNRNIVFDFADVAAKNDENEKRIDLEKALRDALDTAGRDDVDTLALSHLDRDHINSVSEVF